MKASGLARIGKDAELRYTQGGEPVANVSLAFTYGKKGEDGKRPTQWVDASIWGKRAESMGAYLLKGKQIVAYLEDVHLQTYTKGDGTSNTKMVARLADLEFVSDGSDHKPTQKPQNEAQSRPAPAPQGSWFDDFDEIDF